MGVIFLALVVAHGVHDVSHFEESSACITLAVGLAVGLVARPSVRLVRAGFRDVETTLDCRSLARLGSELDGRLSGRFVVLAWYPVSIAIAWLDRNGITWGPATSFLIRARR